MNFLKFSLILLLLLIPCAFSTAQTGTQSEYDYWSWYDTRSKTAIFSQHIVKLNYTGYWLAQITPPAHLFEQKIESIMSDGDLRFKSSYYGGAFTHAFNISSLNKTLADAENERLSQIVKYRRDGYAVYIVSYYYPAGENESVSFHSPLSSYEYDYYQPGILAARGANWGTPNNSVSQNGNSSGYGSNYGNHPQSENDQAMQDLANALVSDDEAFEVFYWVALAGLTIMLLFL